MEITVYSKPNCVQCTATYRKLDKDGIAYTKVNVAEDQVALDLIKSLGYMQAPVVIVRDGGEVIKHWGGFNPIEIDAIKSQAQAA